MKIEIEGRIVEVDDSFKDLSPDEQQATVNEIAMSLPPTKEQKAEEKKTESELYGSPGVAALGGVAFGAAEQALGKPVERLAAKTLGAQRFIEPATGEPSGWKWSRKTGFGAGLGETVEEQSREFKNRQAEGRFERKPGQVKPIPGKALTVEKHMQNVERDLAEARAKAQAAQAQRAGTVYRAPSTLGGKTLGLGGRMLGGAGAFGMGAEAMQEGSRAYDLAKSGNIADAARAGRGALLNALGAAGSAATFVPHPLAKGIGAAIGVGAPALNMLLEKAGYKKGGLAHLADGGSAPKGGSPKKRVAEFVIGRAPRAIKDILESKQAPMLRPSGEGPLLPQVSNPYIAELPDVLPQKRLTRGTNPRLERLINDPRAYEAIEKAMQHGVNIDPKLAYWYGTNRLLTGMQNEGSTFEDFDRLMKHMASASQRNPVPQQNKMGSLLNYLDVTGQLGAPGTKLQLPKGYGSLAQKDIVKRAQEIGAGQYPFDDAIKLGKFYKSYLGYHPENAVVDVIGTRVPTMATRDPEWLAKSVKMGNKKEGFQILKPRDMFARGELTMEEALKRPGFWTAAPEKVGEYAGIEDMWKGTAKGQGYKSGEGQALGWYGSAGLDDTAGLKSKPMTWEESLEQRARERAKETGRHPLDVMSDFLQLKGHLKRGGLAR